MLSRVHIMVHGRVQGVFFRDHTQKWASSLGLYGWVKNLDGGRVEILAEGEKDQLEKFIGLVNQGPPLSRVDKSDINWSDYSGEFTDFRVTW